MNAIQGSLKILINLFSAEETNKVEQKFQNAISNGDFDLINKIGNERLKAVLPNGELPLNYAIRQSQPTSIQALLKLGADPTLCDDQNLNAISTAYYKKDYEIADTLLKHVMKDLKFAQKMQSKSISSKQIMHTVDYVHTFQNTVLRISNLISQKLEKQKQEDLELTELVNELVTPESITDILRSSKEGQSYLHIATLLGDKGIVEKLLVEAPGSKLIQSKDIHGLTPLHYAAALGRLDIMKIMIEKGAQLQESDIDTISHFSLLAGKFNQQSPFAISKYDIATCACLIALWSAQLLPSQFINPRALQALQFTNQIPLIFNFDKSALLLPLLSFVGMNASLLSQNLEIVSLGTSAFLTMNLAYNTFQGLRSCWRNASLDYGKGLLKAAVVYAPKLVLSFNQLRNLGQRFELFSPTHKTQLQALNERDVKCFRLSMKNGKNLNQCFEKSSNIYSRCITQSNVEQCQEATIKFQNYFLRTESAAYDNHCTSYDGDRHQECQNKVKDWKDRCYYSDPGSEGCEKAEKTFKESAEKGFEPNYLDQYWRNDFKSKNENYTCPSEDGDDGEECYYKKNQWIYQCNSDINSEMCKKAEGDFQKAIKNNFVPDYQDEFWRLKALNKFFDCTAYKNVIDADCNYRGGHWEYLCSSEYQPNGQIDCEYKQLNWKQHCKQDLHSEACVKAEKIFQTSVLNDFKPNKKDHFWRQKLLERAFTSPISGDYFFNKYRNWYQECKANINSNNCKNAEQSFEHMLQFEFRKSESQECREAKAKITSNQNSKLKEVQKVYRQKARDLHPDKNPVKNPANKPFIQLAADYEEFRKKCGV